MDIISALLTLAEIPGRLYRISCLTETYIKELAGSKRLGWGDRALIILFMIVALSTMLVIVYGTWVVYQDLPRMQNAYITTCQLELNKIQQRCSGNFSFLLPTNITTLGGR